MKREAKRILEWGVFFACAVIILDVLLIQIPILDWLALGIVFFFAAALIVASIARSVPWEKRRAISIPQRRDELQRLADIVDAAVYEGDGNSSRILLEQVKSIALGAIAGRTKLSKREILELAENHREDLRAVVRDEEIMAVLVGYQQLGRSLSEKELEGMLSRIQDWSR